MEYLCAQLVLESQRNLKRAEISRAENILLMIAQLSNWICSAVVLSRMISMPLRFAMRMNKKKTRNAI